MANLLLVRLPDGRQVRPEEWTPSPLYSSVDIATGALQPLPAYGYAIGDPIPGSVNQQPSTLVDTNMVGQGGVLQEQQELMIFGLAISVFQLTAASVANFFANQEAFAPDPPHVSATNMQRLQLDVTVRLKIAATKDYMFEMFGFFPASCGVYPTLGSARSSGSGFVSSVAIGSNGQPTEGTHRRFATPQTVNAGEAFQVLFEFPNGSVRNLDFGDDTTARLRCRIYTRGLRRRPLS